MSSPFLPLPPLYCANCDTVAVPDLSLGTGPHAAKAECPHCGRFLKWVPERLLKLKSRTNDQPAITSPPA